MSASPSVGDKNRYPHQRVVLVTGGGASLRPCADGWRTRSTRSWLRARHTRCGFSGNKSFMITESKTRSSGRLPRPTTNPSGLPATPRRHEPITVLLHKRCRTLSTAPMDLLHGLSQETRLVVSDPMGDLPGALEESPISAAGVIRLARLRCVHASPLHPEPRPPTSAGTSTCRRLHPHLPRRGP
jgi:hypothetical protein